MWRHPPSASNTCCCCATCRPNARRATTVSSPSSRGYSAARYPARKGGGTFPLLPARIPASHRRQPHRTPQHTQHTGFVAHRRQGTAQIALHCGANDFGSIMIEENVVSSAGARNAFDAEASSGPSVKRVSLHSCATSSTESATTPRPLPAVTSGPETNGTTALQREGPQRVKRGRLLPVSAVFRSGETGSIRTTAQNRPTRRTLPFRRQYGTKPLQETGMQRKGSLKTHGNRPGRRTAKPVRHNGGTSTDNPSNRNVPDAEERQTQRRGRIGRCGPSVASAPRRTISRRACAPSRQAGFSAAASPWASPPHTHPP